MAKKQKESKLLKVLKERGAQFYLFNKKRIKDNSSLHDDCLNPDYCGTGDFDTICDNCLKRQ